MERFRTYSPEDTILSNLSEVSERHAILFEQELAHISELALEWMNNRPQDEEALYALGDIEIDAVPLSPARHLAQSLDTLQGMENLHTVEKNVLLSKEIDRQLSAEGAHHLQAILESVEYQALSQEPQILYQKNSFTDAAYLAFAKLFHAPRAAYTHSYQAACEDLYNGIGDFCILPLENATEGRMNGFLRLIDRFSLKIIAICTVEGSDRSKSTSFALLAKQLIVLPDLLKKESCALEIACLIDGISPVGNWLVAAQLCNLSVSKLHTIPDPDAGDVCHAVFSMRENSMLSAFLIYLTITAPQYSAIGIYPMLSAH